MKNPEPIDVDPEHRALLDDMLSLRGQIVAGSESRLWALSSPDSEGRFSPSARNLAKYLALRCQDLRPLQLRLARRGLSSLGRVEAHVLASIDELIRVLAGLCGQPLPELDPMPAPGFDAGNELLAMNTRTLFGPPQPSRTARIMVTMPSEAASNESLVRALLESGMDCARINCAHDDPPVWQRMIENIRRAQEAVGRDCRVVMDLAGHKLRTGSIADEPALTRLNPRSGAGNRQPVIVALLAASETDPAPVTDVAQWLLTVDDGVIGAFSEGDRLIFNDVRGRPRHLVIERPLDGRGWLAHCGKKTVIGPETAMYLMRWQDGVWTRVTEQSVYLGGHQTRPVKIRLHLGEHLRLTGPEWLGQPARLDAEGRVVEPARIGITTPIVLERLEVGQAVWIDDGKLGGVVEASGPESALLRVTHVPPDGFRLRPDKGINFPGAALQLGPLSRKDLEDLDFVTRHADLVGFSFVETGSDMYALMDELAHRGAGNMGIIAKIETERALRHLPEIMLSAIGKHPLAIMIARGDLAVEIGGERLAEVQEEILWLAEAGHVPVVWATQVLETLAKTGMVSRPELSDAAMSVRAECVMLNKGPFIVKALRVLDGILHRMQDHQQKKMPQLRALQLAAEKSGSSTAVQRPGRETTAA